MGCGSRAAVIPPLVWASITFLTPAALAQAPPSKAGVVTSTEGQSVLTRAPAPTPLPVKVKDDVLLRDRIDTRENSTVRLLLGGKAVITVRELSGFTVTEEAGRAAVEVKSGKLALGVAKSLLRPGEVIEIRTPNAIAAIRGSAVFVDVGTNASGQPQTLVATLHVSKPVEVSGLTTTGPNVGLNSQQLTTVTGSGATLTIAPPTNLTPAQATMITKAFQAPKSTSQPPPPAVVNKLVTTFTQDAAKAATGLGQSPSVVVAPPSQSSAPQPKVIPPSPPPPVVVAPKAVVAPLPPPPPPPPVVVAPPPVVPAAAPPPPPPPPPPPVLLNPNGVPWFIPPTK